VGCYLDLRLDVRSLRLEVGCRGAPLAHMCGNKLGVYPSRIDDGEAEDKRHEDATPDQGGCAPPPGKPARRDQLGRFHGGRQADDGERRTREQVTIPLTRTLPYSQLSA